MGISAGQGTGSGWEKASLALLDTESATERRCMSKSYYSQTKHTECVSMTGKDHLIDANKITFALVSQRDAFYIWDACENLLLLWLSWGSLRVRCVTRIIKQFLCVVSPESTDGEMEKGNRQGKAVILRLHGGQTLLTASEGNPASHISQTSRLSSFWPTLKGWGTRHLDGSFYKLVVASCFCRCSVMSNSSWLHGPYPARLLCPWDSPGKNTGVGCRDLLQGIFPTQGWKLGLLCLLHWQADCSHWATREALSGEECLFLCHTGHVGAGWAWGARETQAGTSLAVQWLRLCALSAGALGLIPGQGTRCRNKKSVSCSSRSHVLQQRWKISHATAKTTTNTHTKSADYKNRCKEMHVLFPGCWAGAQWRSKRDSGRAPTTNSVCIYHVLQCWIPV